MVTVKAAKVITALEELVKRMLLANAMGSGLRREGQNATSTCRVTSMLHMFHMVN
jgi:hypothetical protein